MATIDPHTLHVQQLFIAHQLSLKAFVLALEPRLAEAEDVLQETFLTVTEKAAQFERGSNFFAWSCTIARFKVLERNRRTRLEHVGFSDEVLLALEASAPTAEFFTERSELLRDCVEQLAPRAREIVQLRYRHEHGVQEIARRLSWTANAVSVALSRARDVLRECVQSQLHAREGT